MKFIILLACVVSAIAFSIDDVDRDNLIPVSETNEFRAAYPELAKIIDVSENATPIRDQRVGRVWGGRQANAGELPYQVGIVVLLSRQAFCGGSLVSRNYVLTAASCFPGFPNSIVELGNNDRNQVQEFINVAQTILHPLHNSNNQNDIALLRLVRTVTLTPTINIVRLPNRRQVDSEFLNQLAQISGWGTTQNNDPAPIRFLHIANSPIVTQTSCRLRFPNTASQSTLCTDGSSVQICTGDFGGPMTIRDADGITTQIGVSSHISTLGCTIGWPGVFTRITAYLDWIGQNSDVVIRESF